MCVHIFGMSYGELIEHLHMYTYSHDIALADQGGTRPTFDACGCLWNNVVTLLLIKSGPWTYFI